MRGESAKPSRGGEEKQVENTAGTGKLARPLRRPFSGLNLTSCTECIYDGAWVPCCNAVAFSRRREFHLAELKHRSTGAAPSSTMVSTRASSTGGAPPPPSSLKPGGCLLALTEGKRQAPQQLCAVLSACISAGRRAQLMVHGPQRGMQALGIPSSHPPVPLS